MRDILVVGGGYAGFYAAWKLERSLRPWERKLRVLADRLPATTYGRDIVSLQIVQRPRAAFVSDGVTPLVLDLEPASDVWS